MVHRTLWYQKEGHRSVIFQSELIARDEPLVILGEAGMGKSHLLKELGAWPGYSFCSARQLIARTNPRSLLGDSTVLVIDALDEVAAQRDGDGVDLVLRQLSLLDFPRFILACRVADWRSATGVGAIRDHYENKPLELHLEPFDESQAIGFLAVGLGGELAKSVIGHFNERGLVELLGNPQTLTLIEKVAANGSLPDTRAELFEKAVEVLYVEHRDERSSRELSVAAGLGAAGAAFAAMILTGNEAIARKARTSLLEGELSLSEMAGLPNGADVPFVLGTRLFRADGSDRFIYLHRRIGEYLGAHWLASIATTSASRRRLLAMFHQHGLVPASMRGIHAWLARDPALASAVIVADPMGLVEYGDVADLSIEQVRLLLTSIEALAQDQPGLRGWASHSARGLARSEVTDEFRRLIADAHAPFGLRMLVLAAIRGSQVALRLAPDLRKVVLDSLEKYAIRNAAGEALIASGTSDDWVDILSHLHARDDEDSSRLAIDLLDELDYVGIDDHLVASLVLSHAKNGGHLVGALWRMREGLQEERLAPVLDQLVGNWPAWDVASERSGAYELCDFALALIDRCVKRGDVSALDIWRWLEPLDLSYGYHRENCERIESHINSDEVLRWDFLRHVLLDASGHNSLWERRWAMQKGLPGIIFDEKDVVALLRSLPPSEIGNEKWRDLVQLVRHDGSTGEQLRIAAAELAGENVDLQNWLVSLGNPPVPDWKKKEEERESIHRLKDERKQKEAREWYLRNISRVSSGDFGAVINLAKIYLNLFPEIGRDLPAHQRIGVFLGNEIWVAASQGFEAFLQASPSKPTAQEIVSSFLKEKHWDAGYILVVALAERCRTSECFLDLTDEKLISGLYELRVSPVERHAGIDGLSAALARALRDRGIWPQVVREFLEPQFHSGRSHVNGLWELLHDEGDRHLAAELSAEWLVKFEDLPCAVEVEIIESLLSTGQTGVLKRLALSRVEVKDVERRLQWLAVGVLLDFEIHSSRLDATQIDRNMLWNLRRFTGGRRGKDGSLKLSPDQLEWLVRTFRSVWPYESLPVGGFSGDHNAWDASEYLLRQINTLGNESTDEAAAALERLKAAVPDGYTSHLQYVVAENRRLRVEARFVAPSIEAIAAIIMDRAPASMSDLQAAMLYEIAVVQAKIASDDVESWRGFFSDSGEPYGEDRCRDHLLSLLRQGSEGIVLEPETHVSQNKEVDITCAVGRLRMPIEVKGQWHPDIWSAADDQLDRLYSSDWRAERRGIYLVLWFGEHVPKNKKLTSPGRRVSRPQSPIDLRRALIGRSRAATEGNVEVVVLDVTRPHR